MQLAWHAEGLWETDWIRDVFCDLVESEKLDLGLTCFDDDTIHVVSSNWKPLSYYSSYFEALRTRCKNIVLVHLSDEWFSSGFGLYRHFDAVVRNFYTYLADSDGIFTIPEGYSVGTPVGQAVVPADRRRYAWSFVGEVKASRFEMVAALDGFEPQRFSKTSSISDVSGTKLTKAEYNAILAESVFSPCPMGNAILETWRLYESLEIGCIPITEKRRGMDYFHNLFGPHPIPSFIDWSEARQYAEALHADIPSLLRKQSEIGEWWAAYKVKLRLQMRQAVATSYAPQLNTYAALARNRVRAIHEPLRLAELLRHQTARSLARRLSRPIAPIKRIISEEFAPHKS